MALKRISDAANAVHDLDDINFKLGEIADLLLVLSLLGYGNEVPNAVGTQVEGETLGGCFSVLWNMVDGVRKDIDALGNEKLKKRMEDKS